NNAYLAPFSPDGWKLAFLGPDNTARIWNWHRNRPTSHSLRHSAGIQGGNWAPNGQYLATAGQDHLLCIWDLAQPLKPIAEFSLLSREHQIHPALFSADGRYVLTTEAEHVTVIVLVDLEKT